MARGRNVAVREGDVIAGKYSVERVLGRVHSVISLHVRHLDLGQRLLLKYLPAEECLLPDAASHFIRGAKAALQLSSQHVARTVDAGRLSSGEPYVVTEFLEGSELRELLQIRGGLPISDAIDLLLQAMEAVAEAHLHGMLHGRLSASNLFVTRTGDGSPLVKVMDFGITEALRSDPFDASSSGFLSSHFEKRRRLEALAGLAPEQIRGLADLDVRTDVWALGALLHEMLTGFPLYTADDAAALLAMIMADPAAPLTEQRPDLPIALERVVLRCLEKERSARFAGIAELAFALKPFAPPDVGVAADRITRTLGRTALAPHSNSRALVRVGHSTPSAAPTPPAPSQKFQLLWSTALVAFGVVGGALAAAIVVRGSTPTTTIETSGATAPGVSTGAQLGSEAPAPTGEASASSARELAALAPPVRASSPRKPRQARPRSDSARAPEVPSTAAEPGLFDEMR